MLLFTCDRCKFRSPGFSALCQTCGAHIRKVDPVKEVLYQLQATKEESIFTRSVKFFVPNCLSSLNDLLLQLLSLTRRLRLYPKSLSELESIARLAENNPEADFQKQQFTSNLKIKSGAEGTSTI